MQIVKKIQNIDGKNLTFLAFSHPDWFLPNIFFFVSQKVEANKKKKNYNYLTHVFYLGGGRYFHIDQCSNPPPWPVTHSNF